MHKLRTKRYKRHVFPQQRYSTNRHLRCASHSCSAPLPSRSKHPYSTDPVSRPPSMILYTFSPTVTATAAAMALASALLGLVTPLVSAAAIQDTAHADTPGLLPSRRLSQRVEAGGDAPIVVVVTTTVIVQDTTTTTTDDTATVTETATPSVDATADIPSPAPSVGSSGNATTSYAMPSQSCDLLYCDSGTSYCVYWGGYSSYDYSQHHPVPGETRTAIGTCRHVTTSSHSYSVITGSLSASSPTPAIGS